MKKKVFLYYSVQKSTLVNGRYSYRVMDSLIEKISDEVICLTVGKKIEKEHIESTTIDSSIGLKNLHSLFKWGVVDIRNLIFVLKIYNNWQMPKIGSHWILWGIRTFIIAKVYKDIFAKFAISNDELYLAPYYNAVTLGACWAFREKKKDVWEVQHGYMGKSHYAYSNPAMKDINIKCKPNCFVVWDDITANFVKEYIFPVDKLIITYSGHLEKPTHIYSDEKIILYTMCWATPIPTEIVSMALELNDYRWVFREHPFSKSPTAYAHDLSKLKNVEHISLENAETPLGTHITKAKLHITFSSSAIYEAASLNVKSIFFDNDHRERFEYLGKNLAEYVSLKKIKQRVSEILENKCEVS